MREKAPYSLTASDAERESAGRSDDDILASDKKNLYH